VLLDDPEREVVVGEGQLDDDDAEGEQRAERVDGAAREVDPAALAAAPDQRRHRREDRRQEGERQPRAAEARHSSY